MASENSPANSARMRLRDAVCALYRVRAAGRKINIYRAGQAVALAIKINHATKFTQLPSSVGADERWVRWRTECGLAQRFNTGHGRNGSGSLRNRYPGVGQCAGVRAVAEPRTKCRRYDALRPVVRKVRTVIRRTHHDLTQEIGSAARPGQERRVSGEAGIKSEQARLRLEEHSAPRWRSAMRLISHSMEIHGE